MPKDFFCINRKMHQNIQSYTQAKSKKHHQLLCRILLKIRFPLTKLIVRRERERERGKENFLLFQNVSNGVKINWKAVYIVTGMPYDKRIIFLSKLEAYFVLSKSFMNFISDINFKDTFKRFALGLAKCNYCCIYLL